ncbi:MAG: ABC transporter permease [Anaerolineae bacterium]|nr:ABC transporter permease [Anaerolineae bacterium]
MSKQILFRFVQLIITMWAVVTVVFFLLRVTGDPIDMLYAGDPRPEAAREAETLRRNLGLDRPLPVQYVNYLVDVVTLDFGNSIALKRPVTQLIGEELPYTLRLTFSAFLFAYLLALPIGVLIAVYKNTPLDYAVQAISMAGVSIPSFWLGIMLILLFAVQLEWLPALGVGDGGIRYLILPVLTIAIPRIAFMSRFVRGAMLDVLNEDYLRTARSKGLQEARVIFRHGLKNALIPILTIAGLQLGYLVSGSVIIERVFGLPGIGDLLVDSISSRDFPVTQAMVLIIAFSMVMMNLLVDILYVFIDPRVRID